MVTPAEHGRRHAQVDADQVAALYRAGWSTPRIAAHVGHDAASVYRALEHGDVRPRSISESKKIRLDNDAVRFLYLRHVSPDRIATILGVSAAPVRRLVQELGLPPRRAGRPDAQEAATALRAMIQLRAPERQARGR